MIFLQLLLFITLCTLIKPNPSVKTIICEDINKRIISHREGNGKMPFVTLSFAQTLDGSIASPSRTRMNISSPYSFSLKHTLRSLHDGVLVGIETLLIDEPKLSVRHPLFVFRNGRVPRPIVLDSKLRISACRSLPEKVIVFTCADSTTERYASSELLLKKVGGKLVSCSKDQNGRCDIQDCFRRMKDLNIHSILVEGGAEIIHSCLEMGLVDRVVLFVSLCFTGGYRCLQKRLLVPRSLSTATTIPVGDNLIIYAELDRK